MRELLSAFIGMTLLIAGAAKIRHRTELQMFLEATFGQRVSARFATLVVGFELVLGVLLVADALPVFGAVVACAVTLTFLVVQVRSWKSESSACNCFGSVSRFESGGVEIARAGVLAAASITLLATTFLSRNARVFESSSSRPILVGVALSSAFVLVIGLASATVWFQAHMARIAREA